MPIQLHQIKKAGLEYFGPKNKTVTGDQDVKSNPQPTEYIKPGRAGGRAGLGGVGGGEAHKRQTEMIVSTTHPSMAISFTQGDRP